MLMRAKNIIFLPKYYFLQYILTRPTDPHHGLLYYSVNRVGHALIHFKVGP